MNRSDLPRLVVQLQRAATTVDRYGPALWDATHDWQSPLRSGGGPTGKGGHSDPTLAVVLRPDPLALEHKRLVNELDSLYKAAAAVEATLLRLKPIDPDKVERGRQNAVPPCLACFDPAPQPRRGFCVACYHAWRRADMPDLTSFSRQRRAEQAPPVKQYEHEVQHVAAHPG